jgi:hypothetical protein
MKKKGVKFFIWAIKIFLFQIYFISSMKIFNIFSFLLDNKMIDEDLYNGAIYSAGFMYIWSVTLV